MSGIPASKRTLLFAIAVLAIALLACNLSALVSQPTPPPQPTATSQSTPPPQPTATTQLSNIITNAVMAKDASGDTFDPVGITDSFPANQSIFHAVVTISGAPDNTDFKVNWLAAPSTQIGTFNLKSGGSRNLDFSFKPNAGTLPSGDYKVEIYVNGTLNRTLSFSVSGASQVQPTAPAQAVKPQPSGYVGGVVMAEDTKGANFDPVNPTVTFKPSATFHAVLTLQNAPANTKFTATWYVVDVGGAAPPNSEVKSTEITTDGSRNIDFTLKPAATWPVGSYRVEISVNGVLDTVKTFSVK